MINIIAHRGARRRAPQNTIPAFQKAIELKADGFENDVHLTKDGVIVICHNRPVPPDMAEGAAREGVAIVVTPLSQYAAALALSSLPPAEH